ncbi:F0F1-type ATP synthase, subunit c/archaeal/vacuolar-type H+-ATPase, subunit K [Caldisphaera lagunensis DSM 15908]|uniref:F0F1-type ATP synthase, subunit c/archaeal/vacuolar-type H+-ATPase, subunit K n=1 Tax=Caldisphaera lagunensis (strain DSM 15908 / JCM 11604 / ANMR 0165 / IC-154) TaxID=1056495 RepID=L0AB86_CALLD|nr:hypothetical protein [Caldisphaera lagunensis]AFZ71121.1 F0F1-type ATP synthase, subunit c/archaeal/vacuolar-type H+-ATPase, subunit K [Caldisphaera lagunensis DSM 15908]
MDKRIIEGINLIIRESLKRPKYRYIMIVVALISIMAAFITGIAITHAATTSSSITQASAYAELGKAIGAGLAIGLAGIGGGYSVGVAGAAAISAIAENRELFGTSFIFVVLGEGIAIYGLLVAIIILFVLP